MDSKSDRKRKRSKNFAEEEKELLLIIVQDYKDVIDNKKTDAESCKSKNDAWDKIAKQFNEYAYELRDGKQLKIFYDNHKARVKKYPTIDNPVHTLLSDYEKDLLLMLINNYKQNNNLLKFDNIQHKIWMTITQEFNRITNRFQRKQLELYIFYKNYKETLENKSAIPNFVINIKPDPEKFENSLDDSNYSKEMSNSQVPNPYHNNLSATLNDNQMVTNTHDFTNALVQSENSFKCNNYLQKCVYLKEKHKLKMELLQMELEFKKKELALKQECLAMEKQIRSKELQMRNIEIETKLMELKKIKHNCHNLELM